MPSILFHELVGYEFTKKHSKFKSGNFYLGVAVPDAVNAYGFASKEARWKTHLRDEDLEKWKNNIIEFYKSNENKFEQEYLMGYLIHVLTDIVCDEIYRDKLYPNLLKEGYNYDTAYKYYEDAIQKLENNNIDKKWWSEVKEKLQTATKIPINNINEKMIEDWNKYTIDKYSSRKYEEKGYITEEFVYETLERIENILIKNKIILD